LSLKKLKSPEIERRPEIEPEETEIRL